ncbi:unnamed protein product [Phytomonas sp. EM1]|nr:unnamed protein product [Phytomonas sp. EM1]|eukprot:CCW61966.1 unnamed protein product [Phytomonas sp. isolate EM1]
MMSLVFLGTGASCAIPVIGHLHRGTSCVCKDAMDNPNSLNRRNNVSLLIHLPKESIQNACSNTSGTDKGPGGVGTNVSKLKGDNIGGNKKSSQEDINIIIDSGKTFRHAYFRVLAPRHIHYVDALLLTHGHSDAMQGVGELCELHAMARQQLRRSPGLSIAMQPQNVARVYTPPTTDSVNEPPERDGRAKNTNVASPSKENSTILPPALRRCRIQTYLTALTLENIRVMLPDVAQNSRYLGAAPADVAAYENLMKQVAKQDTDQADEGSCDDGLIGLDIFEVSEEAPMPLYIDALEDLVPMYSLPVEHGKNYISLGFVFGRGTAFKSQLVGATGASTATPDELTEKSCVVYISDVSSIPEVSMKFLLDLVKIDVLVFDLLAAKGSSSLPHTCWDDIMPYLRLLTPKQTFFVGMFCSLEHHTSNRLWEIDMAAEKKRVKELLLHSQSSSKKNSSLSNAADVYAKGTTLDKFYCEGEQYEDLEVRWRRFLEIDTPKLAYDGLEVPLPL